MVGGQTGLNALFFPRLVEGVVCQKEGEERSSPSGAAFLELSRPLKFVDDPPLRRITFGVGRYATHTAGRKTMTAQGSVDLVFESSIRRSEKKIVNPTKALMLNVLDEAGFEGVWELKDSRRIKKKGRERFGAIRLESRAGAKSVRVWCKPRGNDTAFEYSLFPPAGVDLQMAFAVLKRVSPITLRVSESPELPKAVMARALNIDLPMPKEEEIVEVEDSEPASLPANEDLQENPATEEAAAGHGETEGDAAAEPMRTAFPSMELEPSTLLSDQGAMDRALMAIGFVAEFGYAKKAEASSSIVRSLGIKSFVSGLSPTYTSVEGAMRALTMALRKKGRYIERIRCESQNGRGVSEGVRGYRITSAGERRLEAIKGNFGPEVESRLNPVWRKGSAPKATQGQSCPVPSPASEDPAPPVSNSAAAAAVSPVSITRIKDLLASYEDSDRQVAEIDGVLGSMEEEIRNLRVDIEALDLAEKEKLRQIDSIRGELDRIASRRGEASKRLAQKESERKDWAEMKAPHQKERERIGAMLSVLEDG